MRLVHTESVPYIPLYMYTFGRQDNDNMSAYTYTHIYNTKLYRSQFFIRYTDTRIMMLYRNSARSIHEHRDEALVPYPSIYIYIYTGDTLVFITLRNRNGLMGNRSCDSRYPRVFRKTIIHSGHPDETEKVTISIMQIGNVLRDWRCTICVWSRLEP